ncbi:MAG: carboxypeptidase regulatory-like domain-containing protein [Leptospiraceae bacterium]|nr:carboxypeptidase regulatory-like domain-containing protein [Leptospiraceae bacterium]
MKLKFILFIIFSILYSCNILHHPKQDKTFSRILFLTQILENTNRCQGETYQLKGKIRDRNGNGLSNAKVTITSSTGIALSIRMNKPRTETDNSGEFSLTVCEGSTDVSISSEGNEYGKVTINLDSFGNITIDDTLSNVDLLITSISNSKGEQIPINGFLPRPKNIITFLFTSPAAIGSINFTNITLTVPGGTDKTRLIAHYSISGVKIMVNGILQQNGITVNDFTKPVLYTVYSDDGNTKTYTVNVE